MAVIHVVISLCRPSMPARAAEDILSDGVTPAETDYDQVVGEFEGESIYAGEIHYFLRRHLPTKPISQGEKQGLDVQEAFRLATDRRVVLNAIRRRSERTRQHDDDWIDKKWKQIQADAETRGETMGAWLDEQMLHAASYRHILLWQFRWREYLDQIITDSSLEKFFERHRAEFDGTEVRVAHILWKLEPISAEGIAATAQSNDGKAKDDDEDGGAEEVAATATEKLIFAKADELRGSINAHETTFADAARRWSQSPTAAVGGEIGWIGRHDPMSEGFSQAAFRLAKEEVSPPVRTIAGIHLIKCLDIKPGTKTWQEARSRLTAEMQRRAFDRLRRDR